MQPQTLFTVDPSHRLIEGVASDGRNIWRSSLIDRQGELVENLKLPDPTEVAFDGKRLLVVPDSGWELALKGEIRTKGAPILSIPLSKDCKPQ